MSHYGGGGGRGRDHGGAPGRGAQNLPAWMQSNQSSKNDEQDGYRRLDSDRDGRGRDRSRSRDRDRGRDNKYGSSRGDEPRREREEKVWVPRKDRVSNFDVRPPNGVELPPIGVMATVNGIPNSFYSYVNPTTIPNAPSFVVNPQHVTVSHNDTANSNNPMITRHARRIYASGIPPMVSEYELLSFFNEVVTRALLPERLDTPPVAKVFVNGEKLYAFVEFETIELCTACMALDGIRFEHHSGSFVIRVKRPNDYRPEILPPSDAPIPQLNPDVLAQYGVASVGGPGKIFIGGLPYSLSDEQVRELLGAFGPLKHLNLVRDLGSSMSKGYAFCEYHDQAIAQQAITGLNGLQMGDKILNVRFATANPPPNSGSQHSHGNSSHNNMNMGMPPMGMQPMGMQPMGMPSMGMPPMGMNMNMGYNMGMAAPPPPPTSVPPMYGVPQGFARPTRILKLSNMVTHEDLLDDHEYYDIREDIRLECVEHGVVMQVLIPRAKDGFSAALEGTVFVEFSSAEEARSANGALNGRKFAERVIVVQYFDEDKFLRGELTSV